MASPLRSSLQFTSLEKERERLLGREGDLNSLIRKHLWSPLIDYELGRMRAEQGSCESTRGARSGLNKLFEVLCALDKPVQELSVADLISQYEVLSCEAGRTYRQQRSAPLTSSHQPLEPEMISRALERFFEWVRSPSFSQLHAVQQRTLSQMRLYEVFPFPRYSEAVISVFSQYFLLRAGYPPALYRLSDLGEFHQALEEAFQFSSEALVQLNLQACRTSYRLISGRG